MAPGEGKPPHHGPKSEGHRMTIIGFPTQFKSAQPVPATTQAQMDLALRLVLSTALPTPIRGYRHANVDDINEAIEAVGRVHELYVDFLETLFKNLNENLAVTDVCDIKDLVAGLVDLKNDMIGLLAITAERVMEDA